MIDWTRVKDLRSEIGENDFFEVVEMFFDETDEVVASLEHTVDLARECPVFCVCLIWSMLPERSKDDDDFQRTSGRTVEGLCAA